MTKPFDGEAIARADRAFLDSLSDHPLTRDLSYGTPCPPQPDFGPFNSTDQSQNAARLAFFATVIDWMLINWAYREGAFMGKGGAISLVDGEIISLTDLRGRMAPWALLHAGPRGAIKTRSPVDDWMSCPGPPLDPPRGNASRSAAADLRRRRLCQSSTATGRRRTRRKAATSSRSRPISPVSFPTTRSGPGCGTGWRTRRASRGYPWWR